MKFVAVNAEDELPLDLQVGRNCSRIPSHCLSVEDLAKVYAYNVIEHGCDHVLTRFALDDIREIENDRGLRDEVENLRIVIKELEYENDDLRDR